VHIARWVAVGTSACRAYATKWAERPGLFELEGLGSPIGPSGRPKFGKIERMPPIRTCSKCKRPFHISQVQSRVPRSNNEGKVFCPHCETFCGTFDANPGWFVVTDPLSPEQEAAFLKGQLREAGWPPRRA